MKTKFIGLEGFNEIESLSAKKRGTAKKSSSLTITKKTVRFARRAGSYVFKEAVTGAKKLASKASKTIVEVKATKMPASNANKYYTEKRTGTSEYSSSVKEAISNINFKSSKKYAHSAQTTRTHSIQKKKAILAVVACLSTVFFSCATVVSALEPANNNEPKPKGTTDSYTYSLGSIDSDAYVAITKTLINENIQTGVSGLYIDGELIGATSDVNALQTALDQVLIDYRADYDDETTTEFANNVEIKSGSFSDDDIMTVSNIMANAEGKFSIALSTDIVYTKEKDFETEYEYDDSEGTSYEKVKSEGKKGEELVTVRTTFVDGVQTDAVQTGSETIKEPVAEVVIKGTNEEKASGSFMWPVPYTHSISSYYEWRWGRMHWGIDIADSGIYGQDVVASDGGVVVQAGDDGSGYGNYVVIDHGNGYSTCYAHCSSLAVSVGQTVSKGTTIGYIGSTGFSTGPHLHFEVRNGASKLNPLDFVS